MMNLTLAELKPTIRNRVEIAICMHCNKPFLRKIRGKCVRFANIPIRAIGSKTCSKKCSQARYHCHGYKVRFT